MRNQKLLNILCGLSLVVTTACTEEVKGLDGVDGIAGADGASGADGTAGADGADGADGTAGTDADCAGVPALEISGFTGIPTELLYVNFPSDEITIDINGTDIDYSVAGFGLDFTWTSDTTFTVTPSDDFISSYSITATDGCSVATANFDLEEGAEFGVSTVAIIHLFDGAGEVDIRPSGTDSDSNITTMDYLQYTYRFDADSGPIALDVVMTDDLGNETVAYTTPELMLMPNMDYTAVAFNNAGVLDVAVQTVSTETLVDPSLSTLVRASHFANGVGQVDIWDVTNSAALFADLDFGTSSDYVDLALVDATAQTLGLDADDDGTSDFLWSFYDRYSADMSDIIDSAEVVDFYAFMTPSGLPALYMYYPYYDMADAVVSDLPTANATASAVGVGGPINDTGYFEYLETVTITDCDIVTGVELMLQVSDYYWEDALIATLISPNGQSFQIFDGFSYSQQINGTFNDTLTGDMDEYTYTTSELTNVPGVNGSGDWTLSLYHDLSSANPEDLEAWSLNFDCYNAN